MSKTVTIPSDVSRMEITINDKTYTYAGGATVTVPDEVAALLMQNEKIIGTRPVDDPKNAGIYDGSDYIEVYTTADGTLRIKKTDVAAAAGGSDLPEVSGSDNGKVLTVVSGEWAAAAAGGGGESDVFIITFTLGEGGAATADKTIEEITAAANAGKCIMARLSSGLNLPEGGVLLEEGEFGGGYFSLLNVGEGSLFVTFVYYEDDAWAYSESEYTLTAAE